MINQAVGGLEFSSAPILCPRPWCSEVITNEIRYHLICLMAAMTAAEAKVDRACIREQSTTFGVAAAKRICDAKNYV